MGKSGGASWASLFRELARQKECEIIEGHLMPDHVHMLISIPPKYSVGQVMGFHQGENGDSHCAGVCGAARSFVGQQFWARGYWVSTVGPGRSRGAAPTSGTGTGRSAAGSNDADAALSG